MGEVDTTLFDHRTFSQKPGDAAAIVTLALPLIGEKTTLAVFPFQFVTNALLQVQQVVSDGRAVRCVHGVSFMCCG